MSETDDRDVAVGEEARRWVLLMGSGEISNETRQTFDAWVAKDPGHQNAYAEAQRVWSALGQIPSLREAAHAADLSKFASRPVTKERMRWHSLRTRRPAFLVGAAATLGIAIVAVLLILLGEADSRGTAYSTEVAQIREVTLTDGSVVTLGARSRISVLYSDTQRRVTLQVGEAYFSVAKNPNRPFYVTADNTIVRVVGTKFEVHRGVGQVRVAVAEGRVEIASGDDHPFIEPSGRPARTTALTSGQEILTTSNRDVGPIHSLRGAATPAAWRLGRLYYDDIRLVDVVADVSRYYGGRIQLASPELGALRITGSFRTDHIDQMIDNLGQILPVAVVRDRSGTVTLESRPVEAREPKR